MAFRTFRASSTTSGPIPSPFNTAMLFFISCYIYTKLFRVSRNYCLFSLYNPVLFVKNQLSVFARSFIRDDFVLNTQQVINVVISIKQTGFLILVNVKAFLKVGTDNSDFLFVEVNA